MHERDMCYEQTIPANEEASACAFDQLVASMGCNYAELECTLIRLEALLSRLTGDSQEERLREQAKPAPDRVVGHIPRIAEITNDTRTRIGQINDLLTQIQELA